MKLVTVPVHKIKRAKYNPRKDLKPGDPEFEKLKASITRFGYVVPLIWNERTGVLVGGHQRLTVLMEQGAKEVEVVAVDLDEANEMALNIALNQVEGDWDHAGLVRLLTELSKAGADLKYTGFDSEEIKRLLEWSPAGIEFKAYDESVENDVPMLRCKECGHVFPRP